MSKTHTMYERDDVTVQEATTGLETREFGGRIHVWEPDNPGSVLNSDTYLSLEWCR